MTARPASGDNSGMGRDRLGAFLTGALVVVAGALVAIELVRPLRPSRREPKRRRMERNAVVAALGAATVQLCEQPLVVPLARLVERRRWGVLGRLPIPRALRTLVVLAALDYTLYLWHVLAHRVPALWRFHAVHHADLDMDASTAIRFHFGELAVSVPWRAAQVLLLGVGPRELTLWQRLTLISVLFHHSNVRIPERVERWMGLLVVTPRMHGIHHSRVAAERDANWSSGLSAWDRLHGTLRLEPPQAAITLGVAGFDDPADVTLPKLLAAPFDPPAALAPRG